ncbi:MAG: M4 family metallopeptidase [Flavobacteriales bacterium]|nr:M4 family metallopeptidase [Flavobacteriales bacterium]
MKQKIELRAITLLFACFGSLLIATISFAQESTKNWVLLADEKAGDRSEDIFKDPNYFEMKDGDAMVKYKDYTDELGIRHARYYQTYKDVLVDEGHYILHYNKQGALNSMNGTFVSGIALDVTPVIDERTAVEQVLNSISTKNKPILEYSVTKATNYGSTSKSLSGDLVIKQFKQGEKRTYLLCYKFILSVPATGESYVCHVDASNGTILDMYSNIRTCGIGTATGTTFYNGTQTFTSKWTGSIGKYKLKDDCRKIYTYNASNGHEYKDKDNNWTSAGDREGVSAHWALQRAFDFYEMAYNLTGVDGFYQSINVAADDSPGNASWNGNQINVGGAGGGSNSRATLDVCGHEWTHGVDEYSANLTYQNESGALDESFGDIFGEMIEYYVEGMSSDIYIHGSDHGDPNRSLISPNDYNHPSIYQGPFWQDYNVDNSDWGGVHTNSGVQNHWFYLLAEGGSQTVGTTTFSVIGIGIENAAYVAYKNRRDYLSNSSDYADSKNGSILAAIDIWGECDWKVEQVIQAWNAVGVSSVTGIHYNANVNCGLVSFIHGLNWTYDQRVLNDMTSSCSYAPGKTTRLAAGHEIQLLPGSVMEGDFEARIIPCLDNVLRVASYPNSYGGIGNTGVETDELTSADYNEVAHPDDVNIYPNPSGTGQFTLQVGQVSAGSYVEVLNLMGVVVHTEKLTENQKHTFDIATYPKGIYLVRVVNGEHSITKKVIYQ